MANESLKPDNRIKGAFSHRKRLAHHDVMIENITAAIQALNNQQVSFNQGQIAFNKSQGAFNDTARDSILYLHTVITPAIILELRVNATIIQDVMRCPWWKRLPKDHVNIVRQQITDEMHGVFSVVTALGNVGMAIDEGMQAAESIATALRTFQTARLRLVRANT